MTRVDVDFNARDEHGMLAAYVDDATDPVRVGDTVEATDFERNWCLAVVSRIEGEDLSLDPLWRTFATPTEWRVTVTNAGPLMWVNWINRLTVAWQPRTLPTGVTPPVTSQRLTPA